MPLTDIAIKAAKPSAGRRKLSDGGGLHVEVSPQGTKTFKLSYRHGGKQRTMTGGRYLDDMRLADARLWREQAKAALREGRDPAVAAVPEKQQAAAVARTAAGDTFEVVARAWMMKNKSRWRDRHAKWVEQRFVLDVFPLFGRTPIADVSRSDFLALIERCEDRGALEVCRKTYAFVVNVMAYAVATGKAAANPAPDVKTVMKVKPRTKHYSRLSAAQLPEFFRRLERSPSDRLTKLALRWTILTMVRTNETRFFRPEEIEGRGTPEPIWRISGERMKMHDEHIVPLSRQAVAVLGEIEAIARASGSEWQFPQDINPLKPVSENCMLYCLYDLGYKGTATVHGFRALASTVLNEQVGADDKRRFDSDWIELQLAHDERDAVRGAYNAAKYIGPRREMMQWWGDFIEDQERVGALL